MALLRKSAARFAAGVLFLQVCVWSWEVEETYGVSDVTDVIRFVVRCPGVTSAFCVVSPETVDVQVETHLDDSKHEFVQRWSGERDKITDALRKLRRTTEGLSCLKGDTYLLELQFVGSESRRLAWTSDSETKELREIRLLLEELCHKRFAESLAMLKRGRELMGAGASEEALRSMRQGIESLGDCYTDEPIADDTNLKLILGAKQLEMGESQQAYVLFDRVLESRCQVYYQQFLGKRGVKCDPDGDAAKLGIGK